MKITPISDHTVILSLSITFGSSEKCGLARKPASI